MKKKDETKQRGGFKHLSLNLYADQYERLKSVPNQQAFMRDAIDAALKELVEREKKAAEENAIAYIF